MHRTNDHVSNFSEDIKNFLKHYQYRYFYGQKDISIKTILFSTSNIIYS